MIPRWFRMTAFRVGLLATAAVILFQLLFAHIGPLQRLEAQLIDLRFQLRGIVAPAGDIVLVMIDDRSIAELGRWPWSRSRLADLIRKLDAAGARVIAFDLLFNEPDLGTAPRARNRLSADEDFAAATREAGAVVVPFYFSFAGAPASSHAFPAGDSPFPAAAYQSLLTVDPDATARIPEADLLIPPVPQIAEAAASLAHVNVFPAPDGQARFEAAAIRYDERFYPSLPIAVARRWLSLAPQEVRLEIGHGVQIGPILVPTDAAMRFPVNYRGPHGSFPTVSFVDVWRDRVPPDLFAGRIVLIGASAIGLGDNFASPFSATLSGTERYAAIIDSVLQQDLLRAGSGAALISLILTAVGGLAAAGLQARLPLPLAGLGATALAGLVVGVIFLAFVRAGLVLNVIFPLAAVVAGFAAAALHGLAHARREGRQIRFAFAHYLHPAIVDALARNPQQVRLGGEQRVLTVLFSDIRGFSTIAERLAPEALIGFMNEYLSTMTTLVLKHNGLLDKYVGDGILAVYGAPVARPDHALDACRTALAMVAAVKELRPRWQQWGIDELEIGIGINTGPMIIGNIGAAERFDYTVLGDAVNLGERLEKANKQFNTSIIISETTCALVREDMRCRELGALDVQGKRAPVRAFELLGTA